ncbi:MAG: diaminopropionate ammonia-lyase [Salinisphaera sp.]|jgi:diaminopropionate ammonia-lyase|nr:diaminopropionate ammonia-lyase [Salinisphaera sp.]
MYAFNELPQYLNALDPRDADTLSLRGADQVSRALSFRENAEPTALLALPSLAKKLHIGSLHVKDEGRRLGLGSFKALGGAYALIRLVLEEASRQLEREVPIEELFSEEVLSIAGGMTFACATDGNHGRSVAQGASVMGAASVIFIHSGVSQARADAIESFGARIVRVKGNYDDSIVEASRVAEQNGWTILSDMSWEGYEHIPSLVMQGYTAIVRESLATLDAPPTHVFLQAGVGGFAAAIAGHMNVVLGENRPHVTVVDPENAACLLASARAGRPVKLDHGRSTVMAMLECYEPSMVAFRVLSRVADVFMTVDDEAAKAAMRRLAAPLPGDSAIVSGESGAVGLAGLMSAIEDDEFAERIGLDPDARVLIINTEGATDPQLYEAIVGRSAQAVMESCNS